MDNKGHLTSGGVLVSMGGAALEEAQSCSSENPLAALNPQFQGPAPLTSGQQTVVDVINLFF